MFVFQVFAASWLSHSIKGMTDQCKTVKQHPAFADWACHLRYSRIASEHADNLQEWIPDMVWLNVVALSSMTALHDIPDSVFRNDGLWRQWYDAEAPETANVPDYEDRLSKFERMCVVKV